MLKKATVVAAAALIATGAANTAHAAAKKAPAKGKPAAKAPASKKAKDVPGTPHKWNVAVNAGYFTANADTDNDVIWGGEIQTRIKKRQTLGLAVDFSSVSLFAPNATRSLDTLGVHLSLLGHTGEDMENRQPGFYWGGGPSLVRGELDTVGTETKFGWHLRAGVEYKGGGFTELRWVDSQSEAAFNNARLGGLSFNAGYRFSL